MSVSSSSESETPDCTICYEQAVTWTPCCHNPLCEKHDDKYVVLECSLCSNDERICEDCKGINEKSCGCDISE
jgi:hypothetical protein